MPEDQQAPHPFLPNTALLQAPSALTVRVSADFPKEVSTTTLTAPSRFSITTLTTCSLPLPPPRTQAFNSCECPPSHLSLSPPSTTSVSNT
ncbi:hypothetical protein ACOMHN_012260 [Nucella lapillus]